MQLSIKVSNLISCLIPPTHIFEAYINPLIFHLYSIPKLENLRKFERKVRKNEWVRENNEGKHVLKPKNREAAVAQGTYPPRWKYLISGK